LRFMEQRLAKHLSAGSERIGKLKRAVPAANKVAAKELTRRLQSLQDWHTRVRQLLPVVKTFLKLTPG
jgi:DNA-binding HxlR family transcriptional regulator